MATAVIKPKDRAEWLKYRESGIGSSEVATIVGLNPFETPLQLWRRKVGLDAPKEENFFMKAGHYLEDAVVQFWQDETGRDVIKASKGDFLIVDREKPFLRVSPDRTYWLPNTVHSTTNKGILECKYRRKQLISEMKAPLLNEAVRSMSKNEQLKLRVFRLSVFLFEIMMDIYDAIRCKK